jgi:CO/xanthine dehydrogenase Mo-binding subunit
MSGTEPAALPASLQRNRRLDRWLSFLPDGTVEVRSGKVELGQGILTALLQIVADELDVAPAQVRMRAAATDASPDEGVTSGSLSIQDSGSALRLVCAEVRALHVAEAAQRWQVPLQTLVVADGAMRCADGRRLSYAELAGANLLAREASGIAAPKPARERRLIGGSMPRIDIEDKLHGRARFIHDMVLPGMLHGRVLHAPSLKATIEIVDDSAARQSPGVQALHRDGQLFGIVADSATHADRALTRLQAGITWTETETLPDERQLAGWLKSAKSESQVVAEKPGTGDHAVARTLKAAYSRPFIAHASIGTSCAIAQWNEEGDAERLTLWTHSQGIHNLKRDIALALRIDESSVVVQHAEGAGCYGHNGADDVAFDAAWLARATPGRPVRVLWSRADELARTPFGPAMAVELECDLDAAGAIVAWRHDVWSNGHSGRPGRASAPALLGAWALAEPFEPPVAANVALAMGGGAERNALPSYDFAAWKTTSHRVLEMPIRTSALRSLGAFANVFAVESFVDEIAHTLGRDPVALRLELIADPRGRQVVERAVARSGWRETQKSAAREDNVGRGIGYARYKGNGAYCAVVAEIEAGAEIRVRRLTIAADLGLVVNPDGAANQLEGGAIQAASWALKEAVRFDRTRITSDSWEHYPVLRFSEVPAVDVELMPSHEAWLGAGEGSLGPTAAAIGNAVFDALGVRVRDLPLTPEHIVAAIEAAS